MNIALFGTSADPPTQGHQKILRWLTGHYDRVAVWASDNPFKQHGASLAQRTSMLRLVTEAVQQANDDSEQPFDSSIEVYPELSHPRSLISLQRAQQHWPQGNFTFVIGSDLVPQLPRWYAAEALLAQARLLVIPRPGYSLLQSELNWLRDRTVVAIAPIQGPAVSSTDYRQGRIPVISAAVDDYIRREQLYAYPQAILKTTP